MNKAPEICCEVLFFYRKQNDTTGISCKVFTLIENKIRPQGFVVKFFLIIEIEIMSNLMPGLAGQDQDSSGESS